MRLYDWEARLARYIAGVMRRPFQWGAHDCALFAAGGVLALTGHDPAADWRGRYDTKAGGLALIRAAGFRSHVAAACTWFEALQPAMVMAGDLAVIAQGRGLPRALGIVLGEAVYVLADPRTGQDGLGLVPVERAAILLGVR